MSLSKEEKKSIIKDFQISENDTGSPQVQIALLSAKIEKLSAHLKIHKLDKHSRRGLLGMVGLRNKMYKYIEKTEGTEAVLKLKKKFDKK